MDMAFPRIGLGIGFRASMDTGWMDLYSWEKEQREGMDLMSVTGEKGKSDCKSLPEWAGAGEGEDLGEARREDVGTWLERGGQEGLIFFSRYWEIYQGRGREGKVNYYRILYRGGRNI